MTTEQKALLELVGIGVTEVPISSCCLHEADWNGILRLASAQGVTCLVWRAVEVLHHHGMACCCSTEEKLQLFAHYQQIQQSTEKRTKVASEFAAQIQPLRIVALKGIDYARFWPNPLWREFGDLDCYEVSGNSLAVDGKARKIGCKVVDDDYKHTHIHYKVLMVENHHCFTGFAGSREGKALECELRRLFDKTKITRIDTESELLSPNRDFTAVFMIAHAQNHFFYEGISLRMILDWYFFLAKEWRNVEWGRVDEVLERTGIKPFAELLTAFCQVHFGLQSQVAQIETDDVDSRLLERFEDDLFSEKYSDHDRRWRKMIARMLHRYYRMWRFCSLMRMPIYKAVWRTIAFSSFLHRKPDILLTIDSYKK